MSKVYIIIAHNGSEIIDTTPQAENRINSMDFLDHIYNKYRAKKSEKLNIKNIIQRACGIL